MTGNRDEPRKLSWAILPGLILVVLLTVPAWWLASVTDIPAVITALVLGLCASPMFARFQTSHPGVQFAADPLMKIAVACLGAGVNIGLLMLLGWPVLITIIGIMAITIGTGLWLGRLLGRSPAFAILSAGAVAICGSSAALALCCALPASAQRERDLSVVIIAISLLSAIGVLLYPLLMQALGLSDIEAGFVLGGSLHNVAQTVAAGFSMSESTGETATLVKMIRVSLLAPCVIMVAYAFRGAVIAPASDGESSVAASSGDGPCVDEACGDETSQRRRILPPAFLIAFFLLMIAGSAGWLPTPLKTAFAHMASGGLILAMTAIGLSTPIADLLRTDRRSVLLIVLQTAVILGLALAALLFLRL